MVISEDLRIRIVRKVASGLSRRQAAALFEVGPSSAIRFARRYAEEGALAIKPQPPRKRRLDPFGEDIRRWIAMLTSEQSDKWAQFILREQASPSEAFDILYEHGSGRFVRAVTHLTAIAARDEPGSKRARLRALSLIGQVFVFRTARALTLRTLETKKLDQGDIALLTTLIRENIRLLGAL